MQVCQEMEQITDSWLSLALKSLNIIASRYEPPADVRRLPRVAPLEKWLMRALFAAIVVQPLVEKLGNFLSIYQKEVQHNTVEFG